MQAARKEPVPAMSLKGAEFARNTHVLIAAEGVTPEDVMHPGYYAHVASQLKAWDQIEVRAHDGTWFFQVMVLDCSRNWAKVWPMAAPLRLTTADVSATQAALVQASAQAAGDFTVKHRGPRGWSVVRISDGEILREGDGTRKGAEEWLAKHLSAAAVTA